MDGQKKSDFFSKKERNSFFPSFEVFLGGGRPLDHPKPCFRGVANSVKYWSDAVGRLKTCRESIYVGTLNTVGSTSITCHL